MTPLWRQQTATAAADAKSNAENKLPTQHIATATADVLGHDEGVYAQQISTAIDDLLRDVGLKLHAQQIATATADVSLSDGLEMHTQQVATATADVLPRAALHSQETEPNKIDFDFLPVKDSMQTATAMEDPSMQTPTDGDMNFSNLLNVIRCEDQSKTTVAAVISVSKLTLSPPQSIIATTAVMKLLRSNHECS